MKKSVLLCLSVGITLSSLAQVSEKLPYGFKRAHVTSAFKNASLTVPYRSNNVDNPTGPVNTNQSAARLYSPSANFIASEQLVGITFYDLQTNNSVSNRCVVNSDGSVSMAWTYSPDAVQTTTPPFPNRGTGYNYQDPSGNLQTAYPGNASRTESSRTGFTNIVTTPSGAEMTIAHQAAAGNFNRLALNRRSTIGSGAWTLTNPWGTTGNYDTWPKAVGDGENVYVVWQGSGAGATTTSPPNIVEGQNGPIYFSKSTDAGLTWSSRTTIALIDSNFYKGFSADAYSIDAHNGTVAISYGDPLTDVGLLKSTDGGQTWTKTIIQKHPYPFYQIDILFGDSVNTNHTNAGDSKVLIDNNGKCHVWFSTFEWYDDDSTDDSYTYIINADDLFYWNEDMGPDSNYVAIASSQDFNGNDSLDLASGVLPSGTVCSPPFGNYGIGLTGMPSPGIDANGRLFLSYMAIDEVADTTFYHQTHRHIYMTTLAPNPDGTTYDPANWTYPYDIVPSQAVGGDGENQEAAYGAMARTVGTMAYVLYERDGAPGNSLAAATSCDYTNNQNQSSDMVLAGVDMMTLGTKTLNTNDVFVSQNYPNPSLGSTFVNVTIKKKSDIYIQLSDVIGKIIYSEMKSNMPEGTHAIKINTANLSTGLYNYTVIAGGQHTTRQMIVK